MDPSPDSPKVADPLTKASDESARNSSEESEYDDSKLPSAQREPFLAFIPQVGRWAGNVVSNEIGVASKAIVGFPSWSTNFLTDTYTYYRENPRVLFSEIISGFTVAIMQVPESIAFSFVAGVPPISGLQATFWMAVITGITGGKPGMISGAAGALAVVVADLTSDDGPIKDLSVEERLNVLYMTMFVCGLMQIGMAWLRLAKVVRLIPETGLIGFMNGLAIIIFMAQLPAFQYCDEQDLFIECTLEQRKWLTFQDHFWQVVLSLVHVALCMAIMKFWPSVPKLGKWIPASLMGLLVGTLLEHTLFREAFNVATRTVEETAPIKGNLPKFDWPAIPSDSNTVSTMFEFAITLAIIGGVESVLTLQACNEITDTVPEISDSNQELFAQGLANLASGLFSAMGGDAMIGQSTINIMNGARHRVSSTMSGVFMLLFIVALSSFINLLPVSTLTGVLFMVVLSTFQWKTFVILRYGRLSDSAAILLVTLIAVFFNLAVAIGVGIVFSALVHAWDSGAHVDAEIVYKDLVINDEDCAGVKYVHVKGAIFFSSTRKFVSMFNIAEDPDTVIIDFKDALIIDHSAVAAIQGICHRFEKADKRVLLTNVALKDHGRLHRTGDHEALKRQLRHHSDIVDVESNVVTTQEEAPSDLVHVDEANIGKKLGELAMFQHPVDKVDDEVEVLMNKQGTLNIHEKEE
jgi:SulP family sulfate permease